MKLCATKVRGKHGRFALLGFLVSLLLLSPRHVTPYSQQVSPSSPLQSSRDSRYPSHWWTPVPKEGAPAWEVLPQEAGPGEVILSKRNELGLLSNFAATPFTFKGKHYASLEGFWQMMEHYRLILAATREKVRQNPDVRKVLLATGDLILKPDHHQEPNPPPAWRYYEILTQIRTELQRQ